ncbi:MAG: hypothetical protein JW822_14520 [Spirochaetales bacterium]|nr:hypothetical protein [Spirochaetales bacterium]
MLHSKLLRGKYLLPVLLFLLMCVAAPQAQGQENGQRVERGFSFLGFKADEYVRICYITESGTLIPLAAEYTDKIIDKGFDVIITSHGKKIFYSKCDWTEDMPKYNIYEMDISKDLTWQLTQNEQGRDIFLLDVSPDGKKILFSEFLGNTLEICVMGSEGADKTTLATLEGLMHGMIFCCWLNNNEIIYDAGNDTMHSPNYTIHELIKINVINRSSQVLYSGEYLGKWGDLSRGGKLIFENQDDKDGYFDISSLSVHYFPLDSEWCSQYRWAPDGNTIMFLSVENEKRGLYLMDSKTLTYDKIISVSAGEIHCYGWIKRGKEFIYVNYDDNYQGQIYKVNINSKIIANMSNQTGYMESIGMACPHIFVYNGSEFIKLGEIIGKNINKDREKIDGVSISSSFIHDNKFIIRIEESLYEVTYLNYLDLKVGGSSLRPLDCPPELKKIDDSYIVLKKGDTLELTFSIQGNPEGEMLLDCSGYYEPLY